MIRHDRILRCDLQAGLRGDDGIGQVIGRGQAVDRGKALLQLRQPPSQELVAVGVYGLQDVHRHATLAA